MATAETGTLTDYPLGTLLRDLAAESFTGIVHLDGTVRRIICLQDGRVYLAMSSPGVTLHTAVLDSGAVEEAGWQRALEAASGRGSLVEALLGAGAARATVTSAIRELTIETLLELLVPDQGEFRVAEGERHQLGSSISFSVDDLLADASRRLERWAELQDELPSTTTLLRRSPSLPSGVDAVQLDRLQWRIVHALDQPRSLATLIEEVGIGAFGVFDALYDLLREGVVLHDTAGRGS